MRPLPTPLLTAILKHEQANKFPGELVRAQHVTNNSPSACCCSYCWSKQHLCKTSCLGGGGTLTTWHVPFQDNAFLYFPPLFRRWKWALLLYFPMCIKDSGWWWYYIIITYYIHFLENLSNFWRIFKKHTNNYPHNLATENSFMLHQWSQQCPSCKSSKAQ